jgi:phosphonate transport system permease protein
MKSNQTKEIEIKPGFVPPIVAALASLILPGLGQILDRAYRRGLLLFFSFASIVGLTVWRFVRAAPRDTGFWPIVTKGFHLDKFLIVLTVLVGILYIWIIVDAYITGTRATKGQRVGGTATMFMVLIVFFALGWQIGGINIPELILGVDETVGPIQRLAWPWEKAVERPETLIFPTAVMQTPCTDSPPPPTAPFEVDPYVVADPTCGELSTMTKAGTRITVEGYNFVPGVEITIKWKDPLDNSFRARQEGEHVIVTPDENGYFRIKLNMPFPMTSDDYGEGAQEWEVGGEQLASLGDLQLTKEFKLVIEKMIETIFIGMMATFFGVIFALPVSFLAARNLMSVSSITLIIYYVTRGILNIIRSIEPLIWAIIGVIAVGLGPYAGILALTLHSIAALGKLYSEAIESIDPGPIEAIQATGASWVQTIMFAVIPQIIPPFVSFTIYRWDINIRMSTIIGFVGGGGIGFLISQYIRLTDYDSVGIAMWFIAITVAILDYVSAEIRARFV